MRNPPRTRRPVASYAYPGAIRRRVTWGRGITLAPGWRIVDVRGTPRIVDPLGWRTLDLPGDGWEGRGGYTVRPAQIRALSAEGRAWFKATARNVAASDKRIKDRSTVATIAQLNPTIAARHKRLNRWASGGGKALETPAPWNPSGATAACPDRGVFAWSYCAASDGKSYCRRFVVCGCVFPASGEMPTVHECEALRLYPVPASWMNDRIIARHLPRMARVTIRRAA